MTTFENGRVEYQFKPGGEVQPKRFVFGGQIKNVQDIGRRWQDETGEHMLVMVDEEHVFELVFQPGRELWQLRPITPFKSKV